MARTVNQAGQNLIRQFEGCVLHSYPDPATNGAPWTAGIGHTGPDVKPNMTITQAQADAWFQSDLAKIAAEVEAMAGECTDNQFAALCAFAFNVGPDNLKGSTLLKFHLQKKYGMAELQFCHWNRAAGKILPGLTRRRAAEAELYAKG